MSALNDDLLRAVELALAGDWDAAHELVQQYEDDAAAARIHEVLHKLEGDLGNARYSGEVVKLAWQGRFILFNWPRLMTKLPAILALTFFAALFSLSAAAQEMPSLDVQALSSIIPGTTAGLLDYEPSTGLWTGTNGVFVHYGDTVLTADSASVNTKTDDVTADGHVSIESGDQLWLGEHIDYNFKTKQMRSEQFRTGKSPVFAGGNGLSGDVSNHVYRASNAFVTTDDIANPAYRVRAGKIKIVPGKYVEMWNAVLYAEGVPVFYFPYYRRNLGARANNFNFSPGDRSAYGPYLLTTYKWFLGEAVDGKLHLDYRARRGVRGS